MAIDLGSVFWRYTHTHDATGRVIKLAPDGRIVGQEHPNEYFWAIEDATLVFMHLDGRRSVEFDLPAGTERPDTLAGRLVLWPDSGIETRLSREPGLTTLTVESGRRLADRIDLIAPAVEVAAPKAAGDGARDSYVASGIDLLTFHDAIVLNKYGAIEKDGAVVRESLFHFPFFMDRNLLKFSEAELGRFDVVPTLRARRALHALAGVSGNHFHWLLFFVCKIALYGELPSRRKDLVVLLPDYLWEAQRQSAELVAEHYGLPIVRLQDAGAVFVEELLAPFQQTPHGIDIHPAAMTAFAIIKRGTAGQAPPGPERIYVTRSDSKFRRLENEVEIEGLLARFGFTVVRLTGLSLAQQVALFAHARIVIGPHGAGLTNLAFCEGGTRVLEFQHPDHVSWCMKHLAYLAGLDYRFLMGHASIEDRYRIDTEALFAILRDLVA